MNPRRGNVYEEFSLVLLHQVERRFIGKIAVRSRGNPYLMARRMDAEL